ncbi:zinc finger and BTB domain-containing protein 44 isoform X2 [Helicoverpa armigera]|uniref:zinc finger and BTB domain-containing protein 44 isoform X2 n=1 Tax=Helicoverpa armigera TaxID=29058 RepID=UPI003083EDDC
MLLKMMPQQYCLRWKHHHSNVQNMFAQLLEKERFCDVTLYCSPSFATQVAGKDTVEPQNIRGVSLRAHRVVLAACSELLGTLLGAHEAQGEPVLVIDGAEPKHLKALLDYMYTGEMNVHHSQLASLLKTAEELRIKGLTDIRWNNKDEPPDSQAGLVATATPIEKLPDKQDPKPPTKLSPKSTPEPEPRKNDCSDVEVKPGEKFNVNGGPPPLIKLPMREKSSPIKRENSDSDSPSPKRQRLTSLTEHTDEECSSIVKSEHDQEWRYGNLKVYEQDISAERVVGWGMRGSRSTSRDASDDEWADAPADIGSFLHTKLRVDGDNSADEESNESLPTRASAASSSAPSASNVELRVELAKAQLAQLNKNTPSKSSPVDPRFSDVVKLSDYLQHGRRPQFWEENYVRRVMEAVRLKELEMKQAAEILGVSYGTLYGRYRDVYGCINRPYRNTSVNSIPSPPRAVREFWQAKGPSEVLERLQRGELTLDSAATALGVSIANLAAHVADFGVPEKDRASEVLDRLQRGEMSLESAATTLGVSVAKLAAHVNDFGVQEKGMVADFEPIPIEVDPSLKMRSRTYSAGAAKTARKQATSCTVNTGDQKPPKKLVVSSVTDEEPIPATVIAAHDAKPATGNRKWPSIRVASLDSLRGNDPPSTAPNPAPTPAPASPSALMRTRPDLTIVAARRVPDKTDDDVTT